mgnify:FL=1
MWINRGDLDNNYVKMTDKRYYKLISDNRYHFDDYNICPQISIEYVNFEKAENFVKLLNLLNAYLDIRCDCLMPVVPQIIGKSIFLASTNSSRFIDKKDKFKKLAQETEWIY